MTRREAVALKLRQEIMSRQLPPGTVLKDAEIAGRLGVSITPVREAITQLAAEGLVHIAPNRVRKVAEFTQKQALELVDVMELLACEGFARGVENLTDEHLVRLRRRLEDFLDAIARRDISQGAGAGADLSIIVVLAGGNRELQALIDQVVTRTFRLQPPGAEWILWEPWAEGYQEVVEHLEAGRKEEAVARYRQIYSGYRSVFERLLWPDSDAPAPGAGAGPEGDDGGHAVSTKPS